MFTGIITALGTIRAITPLGDGHDMRLVIETPWPDTASIAIGVLATARIISPSRRAS